MQALLLRGASVNIADNDGVSPLLAAIESAGYAHIGLGPTQVDMSSIEQQTVNQTMSGSGGQNENMEQGQERAGQQDTQIHTLFAMDDTIIQVDQRTACNWLMIIADCRQAVTYHLV